MSLTEKTSLPVIPEPGTDETPEIYCKKGMDAFLHGDHRLAVKYFEKAFLMAQSSDKTSVPAEDEVVGARRAMAYAYQALENFTRAIHHYSVLIAEGSTVWQDRYNRGYCFFRLTLFKKAIEDFSFLVGNEDARIKGVGYDWKGRCYRRLEKYELSLKDCNALLELDPDSIHGINNRGAVYMKLQDYVQAFKDFDRTLKMDNGYVLGYTNRGNWFLEMGQYEKAGSDLQTAMRLAPKFGNPFFHYGQLLLRKGEVGLAYSYIRRSYFLGFQPMHRYMGYFKAMPFLLRNILRRGYSIEDIQLNFKLVADLQRECEPWDLLMNFLSSEEDCNRRREWISLQAIVQYYMGDPVAAFEIYQSAIKNGHAPDLRDWFYIHSAGLAFLETEIDAPAVLREIEKSGDAGDISRYYAGQLCRMLHEPEQATRWLERANGFAPAEQALALVAVPGGGRESPLRLSGEMNPIIIRKDTGFWAFWEQLIAWLPVYELTEEQPTEGAAIALRPRLFQQLLSFDPGFLEKLQLNRIYGEYQQIEQAFVLRLEEMIGQAERKKIIETVIKNGKATAFRDEVNLRLKDPDWPADYPADYAVGRQISLQALNFEGHRNMILYFAVEEKLTAAQAVHLLLYAIKIDKMLTDQESFTPAEKELMDSFIQLFWLKLPAGLFLKIIGSLLNAAHLLPERETVSDDFLDYREFERNFYGYFGLFLEHLRKTLGM